MICMDLRYNTGQCMGHKVCRYFPERLDMTAGPAPGNVPNYKLAINFVQLHDLILTYVYNIRQSNFSFIHIN